ncbi:MAG: hypothetical protein L0170_16065, partial [Acidobacteria bacterium]|nr:hypothetical protein [Acidobacteriota bacterium]
MRRHLITGTFNFKDFLVPGEPGCCCGASRALILTPALRPKKVNPLAHRVDPLRSTLKVAFLATLAASCLLSCAILKKPDMTRTAGIAQLRKPQHPL